MDKTQVEKLDTLKTMGLVLNGENPYQVIRDTITLLKRVWPYMRYAQNGPKYQVRITQEHIVETIPTNHFGQVMTDRVYDTVTYEADEEEFMPDTQNNLNMLEISGATEGAFNAAEEAGISLHDVKGTGKHNKITLTDVKKHIR